MARSAHGIQPVCRGPDGALPNEREPHKTGWAAGQCVLSHKQQSQQPLQLAFPPFPPFPQHVEASRRLSQATMASCREGRYTTLAATKAYIAACVRDMRALPLPPFGSALGPLTHPLHLTPKCITRNAPPRLTMEEALRQVQASAQSP